MKARVGRYGVWQLRDYVMGIGGVTLLLGVLAIGMARGTNVSVGAADHVQRVASHAVADWVLGVVSFLGAVVACSGVVSDDRSRGYYRFLLSKPMNPVRFYLQAYAVRGVGFLAITALLWAECALFIGAGSFVGTVGNAALCYLGFGGVTFLFSTTWRQAGVVTLACCAAASIVNGLLNKNVGWQPLWLVLHALLPPVHAIGMASASLVIWLAGYGLVALALAMAAIRGKEWPL